MKKAYRKDTGEEVKVGEKVQDFRGKIWKLVRLSRARIEGDARTGKVIVQREGQNMEFYDTVFDLRVVEE
jgi:hypothetical protein